MEKRKKEEKEYPDLYGHHEREGKKLGFDLVQRGINPVETQNASNCQHNFILEGLHSVKCKICGWGLVTNGVKDATDLIKRLTSKAV